MGIITRLFPRLVKDAQNVQKGMTNQFGSQEDYGAQYGLKGRGYGVYTSADLLRISAVGKDGQQHIVPVEQKYTTIDPLTCLMIFQKCPPIFSVVSSRANRISSLEFHVIPETKVEDRMASELKEWRSIYVEAERPTMLNAGRRLRALQEIRKVLPEIYSDLSNFDTALRRWSKRINGQKLDRCTEIEDFFSHPAPGVLWPDFVKMAVQDLLIQGRLAIYKAPVVESDGSERVGNIHILPGGSVVPIKGTFVGQLHGYVQLTDGMTQPQIFFQDEIAFAEYCPNSSTSWGINPIDSLINLIATNLLFSERMSNMADGSKPPDKAIVFGEKNPGLDNMDPNLFGMDDPISKDEQRRIENKMNRVKREAAIMTLTGVGTPVVLDLSKADTIPTELQYQEKIDRYVAMVYNASNQEINQTGGDGTSGRSTSEAQERADNSKGERPIIRILEELLTRDIIPYRYGFGYRAEWAATRSDAEEIDLASKKVSSGIYSVNEVRDELKKDPFAGEQFDTPKTAQPGEKTEASLGSIAESLKR